MKKWILASILLVATTVLAIGGTTIVKQLDTIVSSVTNGDITLTPNGTGNVIVSSGTATTVPYFDASKQLVSSAVTPTELGYVSGVTSAIQTQITAITFDALSPMTTEGDIIYGGSSGTGTRLGIGADGTVLKLSSGVPVWGTDSTGGTTAYEAITSTDTTDADNGIMSLSGASFTLTLHTAVGNSGQTMEILHQGLTASQVYTLATTSSQTIGGIAGGSYIISTNGENLKIISDGSNWLILDHKTTTGWIAGTAITIGATTTPPTKGTIGTDVIKWRRVGDSMEVSYVYVQSALGSGADGSGDYLFPLPAECNCTIDSTKVTFYASAEGQGGNWVANGSNLGSFIGSGSEANLGTLTGAVVAYNASNVRFFASYSSHNVNRANTVVGSAGGGNGLGNTTVSYSAVYTVPVTSWQP